MIRYTLSGLAIVLPLTLAMPVSAQATVHEPLECRLSIEAEGGGTPPAPAADALPRGCETITIPWSAPVGHRQPQAADVASSKPPSSIDRALSEENARVDQLVKGICRGC
jgi:hypothetical protein